MNKKNVVKLISLVLAISFVVASFCGTQISAFSEPTSSSQTVITDEEAKKKAEEALKQQREELEKNLAESEKKLMELGPQAKNTQEYVDILDSKIGYLNEQLTLLENDVVKYQADIDVLQKSIDVNQKKANDLQNIVNDLQLKFNDLNNKFMIKYNAYCERVRAIYISGSFNLISALLTCEDLSSFLTRYEMIKSVSKNDADLLADIDEETKIIFEKEKELNKTKSELNAILLSLNNQKNQLATKQNSLTSVQEEYAKKKVILSSDKTESDKLLAKITAENKMYTEFKNEDETLKAAVEQEISDLINGLKKPEDVTLATTSNRNDVVIDVQNDDGLYVNSDGVLNMTYPVPGCYNVSCGFGKYSNGKAHTGIDFPCSKGSKVVAAQSGVVIKVKNLDYSYGHYVMIYHGTDSQGRSVVTLYGHNDKILVHPGQTVSKGQAIAKSGSTGNSTGPHCHFEIRLDNNAVNPKNYLSK